MRTLILMLAVASSTAHGSTLFKCVDAKGVATYQQAPCPKAEQTAGVRQIQRVADDTRQSWAAQGDAKRAEEARWAASHPVVYDEPQVVSETWSEGGVTDAQLRKLESIARDRSLTPTARSALMSAVSGTPDPGPWKPPANSQPRTRVDQNGNRYQQPPGSAFVRDEKTGKQCFVNGNQIVECH